MEDPKRYSQRIAEGASPTDTFGARLTQQQPKGTKGAQTATQTSEPSQSPPGGTGIVNTKK